MDLADRSCVASGTRRSELVRLFEPFEIETALLRSSDLLVRRVGRRREGS